MMPRKNVLICVENYPQFYYHSNISAKRFIFYCVFFNIPEIFYNVGIFLSSEFSRILQKSWFARFRNDSTFSLLDFVITRNKYYCE